MKKPIIFIVIFLVLAAIGAGYYFYKAKTDKPLVGGDKDEHGCIGSAGYSWCEEKSKCLRIWEEVCSDVGSEVAQILAGKYDKDVSDVTVNITQSNEFYARGNVSFASEGLPSPGEGGMFLAIKNNSRWEVVFDGNGSIDCVQLRDTYEFPENMLTGVCD